MDPAGHRMFSLRPNPPISHITSRLPIEIPSPTILNPFRHAPKRICFSLALETFQRCCRPRPMSSPYRIVSERLLSLQLRCSEMWKFRKSLKTSAAKPITLLRLRDHFTWVSICVSLASSLVREPGLHAVRGIAPYIFSDITSSILLIAFMSLYFRASGR